MPELPEVETVRRGLEPVMQGQCITAAQTRRRGLRYPFPEDLMKRLGGRAVTRLNRRAKYLLIHLDHGDVLIIHLGMSGRILIVKPDERYNLQKHDHFIMTMENGTRIVLNDPRRFGFVDLVREDYLKCHSAFKKLGPEPLDNNFSAPVLMELLTGRGSTIKTALLNQNIVAGLGNIYVCEALYYAGIAPCRIAAELTMNEAEKLVRAIRDVLGRALEAGGSSLRDYRQADGALGYFQHQFAVYDREGQACAICQTKKGSRPLIKRETQQGRSTFYCPAHQK